MEKKYNSLANELKQELTPNINLEPVLAGMDALIDKANKAKAAISGMVSDISGSILAANLNNSGIQFAPAGMEEAPIYNPYSGANLPEFGGAIGSYALGTPYVPQTGLYQLHKGEAVIPTSENKGYARQVVIEKGAIVVYASERADAEDIANKVVRIIENRVALA